MYCCSIPTTDFQMSIVTPQRRSKDDMSLPQRQLVQLPESGKTSRSPSPIKNRYSLPILPKVDDDIRSVVSSSNELTREQLKQAARSPMAKKLHVISNNPNYPGSPNKYIIPVPFTLKLPPKLSSVNTSRENSAVSSAKSTPQNSRAGSPVRTIASDNSVKHSKFKQSKLVYTGHGYEKVDSSLESEGEIEDQLFSISSKYQDELNKQIALSKRSVPLPLSSSNNKMNKFARNTDELSIIEEVSINESRRSSVLSKLMSVQKEDNEKKEEVQPTKLEVPVPIKPVVMRSEPLVVPIKISEKKENTNSDKQLPNIPQSLTKTNTIIKITPNGKTVTPPKIEVKKHKYNKSLPDIPTIRSISTDAEQPHPIPKSNRESNLKLLSKPNIHNGELKIHKRSFSDESLTSSVSSFSSVGDFMHLARVQAMSPPTEKVRYMNLQNPRRNPPPQQQQQKSQLRILPSGVAAATTTNQSNKKPEPVRIMQKQEIGKIPQEKKLFVQPPSISVDRQVSTSSTSSMESLGTSSSWDSIQKSIDITYSKHDNDETNETIKPKKLEDDESSWLDTSDGSDDEVEQEEENEDEEEEKSEEIKPLNISRQGTKSTVDEIKFVVPDNDGPGISFQFPNNDTNITNSKEVKSRVINEVNRKSRYSFYSNDGHIQIPDLSDKRVIDEYSEKTPSSYNGTTFSEIRTETSVSDCDEESEINHLKIGVPGKEALKHLKTQYDLIGGSESDVEFTTKLNSMYQPSKYFPPPISQPELQCNILLPGRHSPSKHTRRKSMFNIDFDISKLTKSFTGHSRNKSVDLLSEISTFGKEQVRVKSPTPEKSTSMELNTTVSKSSSEESIKPLSPHKNTKLEEQKENNKVEEEEEEELLNIKVAEPPKIVNYEVDFKESNSKGEEEFGSPFVTPRIISKSVERPLKVNPKGEKGRKPSNPTSRKVSPYVKDDEETESVIIDLTKDKYEVVCMIDRSGSTRSYKSTTETINGKDVEVVLVDDDDDEQEDDEEDDDKGSSYDELLSIYSKYRNDTWLFKNNSTIKSRNSLNGNRSNSIIHHKKIPITNAITKELKFKRSSNSMTSSTTSSSSVNYQSNRINHPSNTSSSLQPKSETRIKAIRHQSMPLLDSNYFDYASNENYDFHTFIQQRKLSEENNI